jgi:hypothetical protein
MVTVRVLRFADGKPVTATSVAIIRHGSGFLDVGGVFRGEYTNRDGEVRYSKLDLPAKGKVMIDGHEVYDGNLDQSMTFKI